MAARNNVVPEAAERELVITRTFDAPRELVFAAFTDPARLMRWWGPHGCTVISCEADPRPGGTWRIAMRSPKVLPQFVHRHPIDAGTALVLSHALERLAGILARHGLLHQQGCGS